MALQIGEPRNTRAVDQDIDAPEPPDNLPNDLFTSSSFVISAT